MKHENLVYQRSSQFNLCTLSTTLINQILIVFIVDLFYCFVSIVSRSTVLIQLE